MRTLNLGILAHIDAGKTSLTERLLFKAGIIDAIGRVDDGTTQTDTLALERQRGITIKTAVMSFTIGDLGVNLIDTPGHPDFIAEVERVLGVLDGAVLVVSAVEGVQAQTRILMRALKRLGIPTLIFVNKIDRSGARDAALLAELAEKLTPAIIPMVAVRECGTRHADVAGLGSPDIAKAALAVLAENDEAMFEAFAGDREIAIETILNEMARQVGAALVHAVYFGSATTGVGIEALVAGLTRFFRPGDGDIAGAATGTVFKVERGQHREKIAYVRMTTGRISIRDQIGFGANRVGKVTGLQVFDNGPATRASAISAGQIGKLWGLDDVRVGDAIGDAATGQPAHHFAPPTLETVVVAAPGTDPNALHQALVLLAEQDPLINLRQGELRNELSLSLYGEVQKEVIGQMLADDYGVVAEFRETTPICIERPVGTGRAMQVLFKAPNPFVATVGLRIEPAPERSGVRIGHENRHGTMPLTFHEAIDAMIGETLRQGLHGWEVTDCVVTVTDAAHHAPISTAADFRGLTPIVLMAALRKAETQVCEPIHRFHAEGPEDRLAAVLSALVRLGATLEQPAIRGATFSLEGEIRVARVHEFQQVLPGLTGGQGTLECEFSRHMAVSGVPPVRLGSGLSRGQGG